MDVGELGSHGVAGAAFGTEFPRRLRPLTRALGSLHHDGQNDIIKIAGQISMNTL